MAEDWKCVAQPRAAVPTDCNWPNCGCDPHAERVIEGLREAGWMDPDDIRELEKELQVGGFFVELGIVMWAIVGAAGVLWLVLFLLRVWIDAQ